jgi:hypothetical protein
LQYYLSDIISAPVWAPNIYSIEDFVFEITGLQKCESVDLLFDLYSIHRNLADEETRTFDAFIPWGEQLINDFNDIDFNLVDAAALFAYLSDAKAIERWHIDGSDFSKDEKKYLEFYRSLIAYYNMLKEKVSAEQKAWNGLAYRLLYEKFEQYFAPFINKHFYLIGFNALTRSEEAIFKKICQATPSTIVWDTDEYYVKNLFHEAGTFFRKQAASFGLPISAQQNFKKHKNIVVSGRSKIMGQLLKAKNILEQLPFTSEAPDDTVVVLNDERLLLPLLDFLPKKYQKFNITMGLPAATTLPHHFIIQWMKLHLEKTVDEREKCYFSKRRFYDFMQHPLMKALLSDASENGVEELEENMELILQKENITLNINTIKHDVFESFANIFNRLGFLFEPLDNNPKAFIEKIRNLISLLFDLFQTRNDHFNLEFLFYLNKMVNRMTDIDDKYDRDFSIQTIFLVFNKLSQNLRVPFSGDPISGLQIMGMLETRLLDFKNVILLSMNEGIIPHKRQHASFIPFDLRMQFDMPIYEDNQSITAYHFYRLLQRAENIYLIYNNDSSTGIGSKEQSRFITQLLHELPKYNSDIHIITEQENLMPHSFEPAHPLVIEKTPFAMKRLDELAKTGFSLSAINDYLACPVEFYLKRIAGIKEKSEFSDTVDAATFGSILHNTISDLHKHLIDKPLVADVIKELLTGYQFVLKRNLQKFHVDGDFNTGHNLLTRVAAEEYIRNFLINELTEIEQAKKENNLYLIKLQEETLNMPLHVEIQNNLKTIMITGIADRIVQIGNVVRIIDFKTGKVEKNDVVIKDSALFLQEKNKPKAVQLLLYAWLLKQNKKIDETVRIEAAIIPLRNPENNILKLSINEETAINEEIIDLTTNMLKSIFQEMFDPNIPFIASDKTDAHKFSSFELLF